MRLLSGNIVESERDAEHFRFLRDAGTAEIPFEGGRTPEGCVFPHTEAVGLRTSVIDSLVSFILFRSLYRKKANWQIICGDRILDNEYLTQILTRGSYPERILLEELKKLTAEGCGKIESETDTPSTAAARKTLFPDRAACVQLEQQGYPQIRNPKQIPFSIDRWKQRNLIGKGILDIAGVIFARLVCAAKPALKTERQPDWLPYIPLYQRLFSTARIRRNSLRAALR